MANVKRFRLMDEQGNVIVYDIGAGSITFDDRNMTLPQVIAMLEAAIEVAGQVKAVTMNGTKIEPNEETGDINLGTVVTDVSDKANKDELTVTNGASADKKVIQLKNGTDVEVIISHQDISGKVDKVNGKGLSTEDYTTEEKNKLAGIAAGATANQGTVTGIKVGASGTVNEPTNGVVTLPEVEVPDQVQADWEEDDTSDPAHIKNKPTFKTVNNESIEGEGNISIPSGDDGKSAYEIAVDNGFEGSEAEWLASLKGLQGDQGNVQVDGDGNVLIVNNLTEGGGGAALSAEMGKELNERLEDAEQAGGLTASVVGTTLYLSRVSAGSPVVNVGQLSKLALSARGGQTDTATFTISGRRLTGNIGIALSDGTNFALSASSLTPTDGKVSSTTITVTYRPASGATAGTTHSCTITISMGGTTYGTLSLNGTVASAPSIALSPATLAISALSGEVGSGTINVSGSALEGDITLALSNASYMSFDANSSVTSLTVTKAEAEASGGKNVTIYYTGTANDSGTLTASSTGASSVSASVNGSIREAAPVDTTFTKTYDFGSLTFVVRDKAVVKGVLDNGVYKRSGNDSFAYNADDIVGPIVACKAGTLNANADVVIPATVEYDGITYTVTEISTGTETIGGNATGAFKSQTNMKTLTFAEGSQVRMIDKSAFYGCTNLISAVLPDSVVSLCSSGGSSTFANCTKLESVVFGTGLTRTFTSTFNGNTALKYITFKGAPTLNGLGHASLTQFTQATYTEGISPVVTCMSMTAPSMIGTPFPRNTDKRVSAKLRYPAGATGYDVGTAGGSSTTGCWPDFLEIETFTPNS